MHADVIHFEAWDRERERRRKRGGSKLAIIDGLVFTDHFLGSEKKKNIAVNMFTH